VSDNGLEQFLAELAEEYRAADRDTLLRSDPLKFQLCLAGRFAHDVGRGGFAQLLYNMNGNHLAEVEDMLIAAKAFVAQDHYVEAIRACLGSKDDYQRFLASNFTDPNPLKDKLQLVTLAYFASGIPFAKEAASFLASARERPHSGGSAPKSGRFSDAFECYETIGRLISAAIPEPWTQAVVKVTLDIEDQALELAASYTPASDDKAEKSVPYISNLDDCFYDLAPLVSTEAKGYYKTCEFTLWPSGRYDTKFGY
jgi:hypothetical protein